MKLFDSQIELMRKMAHKGMTYEAMRSSIKAALGYDKTFCELEPAEIEKVQDTLGEDGRA